MGALGLAEECRLRGGGLKGTPPLCPSRSAPPTLETIRPKQEWETRLSRIRKTKESVRVRVGRGEGAVCAFGWTPGHPVLQPPRGGWLGERCARSGGLCLGQHCRAPCRGAVGGPVRRGRDRETLRCTLLLSGPSVRPSWALLTCSFHPALEPVQ